MSARKLGAIVKADDTGQLQRELSELVERRVIRIRADSRADIARLQREHADEIARLKAEHANIVARLRLDVIRAEARREQLDQSVVL